MQSCLLVRILIHMTIICTMHIAHCTVNIYHKDYRTYLSDIYDAGMYNSNVA